MVEQPWQGSAILRPGVLAFSGTIGATDTHAHHAVQIMIAPRTRSMSQTGSSVKPVGTLLGHSQGLGGVRHQLKTMAFACKDLGGRGGDRTHDRWCVKPELYH